MVTEIVVDSKLKMAAKNSYISLSLKETGIKLQKMLPFFSRPTTSSLFVLNQDGDDDTGSSYISELASLNEMAPSNTVLITAIRVYFIYCEISTLYTTGPETVSSFVARPPS